MTKAMEKKEWIESVNEKIKDSLKGLEKYEYEFIQEFMLLAYERGEAAGRKSLAEGHRVDRITQAKPGAV